MIFGGQARLRKIAYLHITGILEQFVEKNSLMMEETTDTQQQKNWTHRLMDRIKQIDDKKRAGRDIECRVQEGLYIPDDQKGVFGVSLDTIYRQQGACLPRNILQVRIQ